MKKDMVDDEVEAAGYSGNSKREDLLVSSSDNAAPCPPVSVGGMVGPIRRSTRGGWTEKEDKLLAAAVKTYSCKNWRKIAECVPGRTNVQCLHRWQKVLNPQLIKGPWKKEEDDRIRELVAKYGCKKWAEIAKHLPGRMGKQCRERWCNHLNPNINRGAWTKEEEMILIRVHEIYGNRWAEIAKFLKGRTENSIKNHWNCSMTKRLQNFGAEAFNYSTESEAKLNDQRFDQNINFTRSLDTCSLDLSIGRGHIRDCQSPNSGKSHCNNARNDGMIKPVVETSNSRVTSASDLSSEDSRRCKSNARTIESRNNICAVQHRNSDNVSSVYPSNMSTVSLQLSLSCPSYSAGRKDTLNDKTESAKVFKSVEENDEGRLCYQSSQQEEIFVKTEEFLSTDSYSFRRDDSTSVMEKTGSSPKRSPEYILMSAAKSYKNVPSIIRKRK